MIIIGSARVDENGKYAGGKPGDQKQTAVPDFKGEVAQQEFYVSAKGWNILRPKNPEHAAKIAHCMETACNNPNIGYAQTGNPGRYGILADGVNTKKPTNCDCSSLVRECVKEGTGKDPGDFTTANEAEKLVNTGLFDKFPYVAGMSLYAGDIIVTKVKGHTCIIIKGEDAKKSIQEIAQEVIDGKWGSGIDRKNRLHAAGYDYAEIQAEVNRRYAADHVSQKGIDLIKKYEGCRLKAYKLAGERYFTIGYGHSGADVYDGMSISQAEAENMLRSDLVKFEGYVKKYVNDITLTQHRLDALVSYTYNRGPGKLSAELAANCHTVQEYADGIVKYWGSNQRYKDALIRRRKEEKALFLS